MAEAFNEKFLMLDVTLDLTAKIDFILLEQLEEDLKGWFILGSSLVFGAYSKAIVHGRSQVAWHHDFLVLNS